MSKEKLQKNNEEPQVLALARESLRRAKEMDLTPEEKGKMDAMIDEAKKEENSGSKLQAFKVYQRLLRFLEKINKGKEIIKFHDKEMRRDQAEFLNEVVKQFLEDKYGGVKDIKRRSELMEKELMGMESAVAEEVKEISKDGYIISFDCHDTYISKLPELPRKLQILNCSDTHLVVLPGLPEELIELNCSINKNLKILPQFPPKLQKLNCGGTYIDKLPVLPEGLKELDCAWTSIKDLPDLPDSLQKLDCEGAVELPADAKQKILAHKNAKNFRY